MIYNLLFYWSSIKKNQNIYLEVFSLHTDIEKFYLLLLFNNTFIVF